MILYGSRAANLIDSKVINRTSLDFDFCCTMEEYHDWFDKNSHKINITKNYEFGNKMIIEGDTNVEFEIIKPNTSSELLHDLVSKDSDTIHTSMGMIPSMDMLFTLKTSHRYLKNSPHFWKTLFDYHRMKASGAKIREEYQEFLKVREKETYNYLHPKLNVNKDDFFKDDNITYLYDHDSIHEACKLQDKPAYTYYLKDGSEVMCSMDKFFACDRSIQLAGVIEEAAVLAIERSLLPHFNIMSVSQAWHFAFSKVCSSITSGKFREYSYCNAPEILSYYPYIRYYDRFKAAMNSGKIKHI
jgi:hypothetical protein